VSVSLKAPEDIAKMRIAGRLAAELLDFLEPHVQPGITTGELDRIAHDHQVNVQHVVPSTLNYAPPGHRPYPASICTSVNHVVCHGIPGDKRVLDGDIINIDVTVILDGWHGDTSRMYYVGEVKRKAQRLVEITYESMMRGIAVVKPAATTGDIGYAIQSFAEGITSQSFASSVAMGSGGGSTRPRSSTRPSEHRLGYQSDDFHDRPMINAGRAASARWRMAGPSSRRTIHHSAQWEHTVLVTPDGTSADLARRHHHRRCRLNAAHAMNRLACCAVDSSGAAAQRRSKSINRTAPIVIPGASRCESAAA
jgi:methionyl aminopeptidase